MVDLYYVTGRFLWCRSLFPCNLRVLSISSCRNFDDRGCQAIASLAPTLESLHLSSCNAITPVGFRELEKLRGLRHLAIDYCRGFNATSSFPLSLQYLRVWVHREANNAGVLSYDGGFGAIMRLQQLETIRWTDHRTPSASDVVNQTINLRSWPSIQSVEISSEWFGCEEEKSETPNKQKDNFACC